MARRQECTLLHCVFQCKCKSEAQPKKVTGLGCAQGGTPYCPDVKEPTFVCKDGTKFSRNDVLRHQAAGRDECVCADGVMPRDQLYKNRSSRKIDSRRLFSREYDFSEDLFSY